MKQSLDELDALLKRSGDPHACAQAATDALRRAREKDVPALWKMICDRLGAAEVIGGMAVTELEQDAFWAKKLRMAAPRAAGRQPRCIGVYYYSLRNGGAQRAAAMLIRLWHGMGLRVVLFTDGEPQPDEYALPGDVSRIALPPLRLDDPLSRRERIRLLHQGVREHGVDVMVYHAWLSPMMLWDMLAVRTAGAGFCIHTHSIFSMMAMEPSLHGRFRSTQAVYALADGVVCMTKADEAYWRHFCGKVYRVVHPLPFRPEDVCVSDLAGHRLTWVGRLSEEKHPEHALAILEAVRRRVPDAHLTLVGGDPAAVEGLRRQAEGLKIAEAVTFAGFTADVAHFYEQTDVFLCTSDYEGFCLTIMEAQSHGVPVVTYDMPYLPLLESGKGSVAVPRGDVAAAADAAVRLLQDDDLRRATGREAAENVRACIPEDYEALWRGILAGVASNSDAPPCDDQTLMLATLAEHLAMQKPAAAQGSIPTPERGPFRVLRRKACTFLNLVLLEGFGGLRKALKRS